MGYMETIIYSHHEAKLFYGLLCVKFEISDNFWKSTIFLVKKSVVRFARCILKLFKIHCIFSQ
jgi:hypothetical protein